MKTLFLSIFLATSSFVFSQFKPILYSWSDYHGTYLVSNIQEDGDNFLVFRVEKVSIEMLKARNQNDLAATLSSKGLRNCNNIEVFEVSKDGTKQSLRKNYWMIPGNTEINPEKKINQFYSEAEISKLFPQMFRTETSQKFKFDDRRIKTYDFDTYNQQYFLSKSDFITCEHPTRKDKIASRAIYNTVYDPASNNIVAVYPAEKNDEDKYFSYKNYEIILSTTACKILNQFKVTFDYPRSYKMQKTVYDINNSKKTIGQLLFFERMNAGKQSDPNKESVQIVYCSDKGETISSIINFRADSKGWEKIHGIFGNDENIYISYHSYGSDGSFFGVKKINKNGECEDFKYTESQLKANTVIPTGNIGQLSPSRKELGALSDKPEFRWGIQEFQMQGFQKTNSKLFIWGKAVYLNSDPNYTGTGMPPTVRSQAEAFVFVYNYENMAFEKMYMLSLPCIKTGYEINLIATDADKVEFFVPIPRENNDYLKTVFDKNSSGGERFGNYSQLVNPLFLTIENGESKFQYYKDVYTLDLEKGLVNCKDGSKYIVGIDIVAGEDRDDSGELAYRNKHYFHIIPVKY